MTIEDDAPTFPPDLSQLSRTAWLGALRRIGKDRGFAEPLGAAHAGIFVEEGDTLLICFESIGGIQALSETRTPFGFTMLAEQGWSSLTVLSHGDTWFRDPQIYAFFDQLLDDGFFDEFERIVFFGAGPCGYAAGAYSVAAPGARVLMLQPQATLDPRLTEWDDRFTEQRRRDFTSRYGFAPDMMDAAHCGYLLYDPREPLDAMHSALFARPNVRRFRLPFMGGALQTDLLTLNVLPALLSAVADDTLDTLSFAALLRARRNHPPYLRRLMARLDEDGRTGLLRMLCENVTARMDAPRFRRKLEMLNAETGA